MTTRTLHAAGLAVSLLLAPVAAGAAGPADQAAAVELFKEARKLMESGDYEHACPKFTEAQRLLPTPGTMLSIGLCYEKAGKLASAYGAYKEAEVFARKAGADGHEAEAQQRAAALALKVAKLAIIVPPAAKVQGFELRRDGSVIGEAQWGSPMPADTGWHQIEATAPGKKAWATFVRIETDGSSASVNVPVLPADVPVNAPPTWGAQRITGVALAGVGLVGIVVGSVFGVKTRNKNSDSLLHCLPNDVTSCDASGVALREDAYAASRLSTGTFIAGGALLVAGAVTFFSAPSASSKPRSGIRRLEVRPVVGLHDGALTIRGAW
jgi:predicted outer membrane protein